MKCISLAMAVPRFCARRAQAAELSSAHGFWRALTHLAKMCFHSSFGVSNAWQTQQSGNSCSNSIALGLQGSRPADHYHKGSYRPELFSAVVLQIALSENFASLKECL